MEREKGCVRTIGEEKNRSINAQNKSPRFNQSPLLKTVESISKKVAFRLENITSN